MSTCKKYAGLHLILLVYSICGLLAKIASQFAFLSTIFIILYVLILLILFIYAIIWQQILKKMPLTTAFANKSVTMVWGMIWGSIFFKEKITVTMIIGTLFIFLGIYLVVNENE